MHDHGYRLVCCVSEVACGRPRPWCLAFSLLTRPPALGGRTMVGGAGSLHRVQISQVTLPLSQQAGLFSVSAGSGVQDLSLCGLDLDGMVKESGRQMMDFTLSHNNGRRMPSPHVSALVVSTFVLGPCSALHPSTD